MNQLFAGDLHANLDKINADMVQFTKNRTKNGLPKMKDTFAGNVRSSYRRRS